MRMTVPNYALLLKFRMMVWFSAQSTLLIVSETFSNLEDFIIVVRTIIIFKSNYFFKFIV
jgi:hypothetical protein